MSTKFGQNLLNHSIYTLRDENPISKLLNNSLKPLITP